MSLSILIADDDQGIRSALVLLLKSEGFFPQTVDSPEQALIELRRQDFSLILMDLNYSKDTTSGDEGLKLINDIRKLDELIPIVVMTGWGTIEVAVSTIKHGANDFIQKPWENDRLLAIINNQTRFADIQKQSQKLNQINQILKDEASPNTDLITQSSAMQKVLETITQVSKSDVSILFTGENGTGKSLFARYLHNISIRRSSELVSVNMGAVTESLFESEMFGHVKGAFTDAKSTRIGRFELADEGTLFLDEIANTLYSQQGKLLRVLEESQFEKVGSSKTQTVNVRLITATNTNLDLAVSEGRFRQDLLYRLNTIEIEIPPLRQRIADIIPLANSFLAKAAKKYSQTSLTITDDAQAALKNYSWPGNVRELSNVMERAHILSQNNSIQISDLGLIKSITKPQTNDIKVENKTDNNTNSENYLHNDLRPINEIEADVIDTRLNYFDGNAEKTAKSLGLSRSAFYRKTGKSKN